MNDFEKQLFDDILVEKVNLQRATLNEASIMKQRLFEDIQLKNNKIIIDISKCSFIDSAFLGVLVVSLKKITKTGGIIKLVIADPSVSEGVLNISGVQRVFEHYTSIEDALESFGFYDKGSQFNMRF